MITSPPIDELLKRVPSKYALVILASKRARQLNAYQHALGEGQIDSSFAPPQIESSSRNYLTMALEELAAGTLEWEDPAAA
jgi:DNA-directed RNA polymerase subunit omega